MLISILLLALSAGASHAKDGDWTLRKKLSEYLVKRINDDPLIYSMELPTVDKMQQINENLIKQPTLKSEPRFKGHLASMETSEIALPKAVRQRRCHAAQRLERRKNTALDRAGRRKEKLKKLLLKESKRLSLKDLEIAENEITTEPFENSSEEEKSYMYPLLTNTEESLHKETKRSTSNEERNVDYQNVQAKPSGTTPIDNPDSNPKGSSLTHASTSPLPFKEYDAFKEYLQLMHQQHIAANEHLKTKDNHILPTSAAYEAWQKEYGQKLYDYPPWDYPNKNVYQENNNIEIAPKNSIAEDEGNTYGNNPKWHYSYGAVNPQKVSLEPYNPSETIVNEAPKIITHEIDPSNVLSPEELEKLGVDPKALAPEALIPLGYTGLSEKINEVPTNASSFQKSLGTMTKTPKKQLTNNPILGSFPIQHHHQGNNVFDNLNQPIQLNDPQPLNHGVIPIDIQQKSDAVHDDQTFKMDDPNKPTIQTTKTSNDDKISPLVEQVKTLPKTNQDTKIVKSHSKENNYNNNDLKITHTEPIPMKLATIDDILYPIQTTSKYSSQAFIPVELPHPSETKKIIFHPIQEQQEMMNPEQTFSDENPSQLKFSNSLHHQPVMVDEPVERQKVFFHPIPQLQSVFGNSDANLETSQKQQQTIEAPTNMANANYNEAHKSLPVADLQKLTQPVEIIKGQTPDLKAFKNLAIPENTVSLTPKIGADQKVENYLAISSSNKGSGIANIMNSNQNLTAVTVNQVPTQDQQNLQKSEIIIHRHLPNENSLANKGDKNASEYKELEPKGGNTQRNQNQSWINLSNFPTAENTGISNQQKYYEEKEVIPPSQKTAELVTPVSSFKEPINRQQGSKNTVELENYNNIGKTEEVSGDEVMSTNYANISPKSEKIETTGSLAPQNKSLTNFLEAANVPFESIKPSLITTDDELARKLFEREKMTNLTTQTATHPKHATKQVLSHQEEQEINKLAKEVAQDILELQKVYLKNLPENISSHEYGFSNAPQLEKKESRTENYYVLNEDDGTLKKPYEGQENKKNHNLKLYNEGASAEYPLKYLKDNIKTNEPYEVIVEGQKDNIESLTELPDPDLVKMLENTNVKSNPLQEEMKIIHDYLKQKTNYTEKLSSLLQEQQKDNNQLIMKEGYPINKNNEKNLEKERLAGSNQRFKSYTQKNDVQSQLRDEHADTASHTEKEDKVDSEKQQKTTTRPLEKESKVVNKTINSTLDAGKVFIPLTNNYAMGQVIVVDPNQRYDKTLKIIPIPLDTKNQQNSVDTNKTEGLQAAKNIPMFLITNNGDIDPFYNDDLAKSAPDTESDEDDQSDEENQESYENESEPEQKPAWGFYWPTLNKGSPNKQNLWKNNNGNSRDKNVQTNSKIALNWPWESSSVKMNNKQKENDNQNLPNGGETSTPLGNFGLLKLKPLSLFKQDITTKSPQQSFSGLFQQFGPSIPSVKQEVNFNDQTPHENQQTSSLSAFNRQEARRKAAENFRKILNDRKQFYQNLQNAKKSFQNNPMRYQGKQKEPVMSKPTLPIQNAQTPQTHALGEKETVNSKPLPLAQINSVPEPAQAQIHDLGAQPKDSTAFFAFGQHNKQDIFDDNNSQQIHNMESPENYLFQTDFKDLTEKRSCSCGQDLHPISHHNQLSAPHYDQVSTAPSCGCGKPSSENAHPLSQHINQGQQVGGLKNLKDLIAEQKELFQQGVAKNNADLIKNEPPLSQKNYSSQEGNSLESKEDTVESGNINKIPSCGCGLSSKEVSDTGYNENVKAPLHTCACSKNGGSCEKSDMIKAAKPEDELNKYDILHNMILWLKHYGAKDLQSNII